MSEASTQADMLAEGVVLSACLLKPDLLDELIPLLPDAAWYSDANRWVWRALCALRADGGPIDVVLVASWLNQNNRLPQVGGTPYLALLTDATPSVVNAQHHAMLIRDKWRARQAISKAQEIVGVLKTNSAEDLQGYLESAEEAFGQIAHQSMARDLVLLGSHADAAYATMQMAKERGVALLGAPTGITHLDAMMMGLVRGDLYVVAGRPGMGKTAYALNVAMHVAGTGDGVAFFSLEQLGVALAQRALSIDTGIVHGRIRNPIGMQPNDWDAVSGSVARIGALPLWVDDYSMTTLGQIRARVRKLKSLIARGAAGVPCGKLALVVIDYLQFMHVVGERGKNREQEISSLSRGCKQIAKDEDVAVMLLSQLNRSVENRDRANKRPELRDLRESGAIEQDADTVLFLYRPEYYMREPDPLLIGWCEVIVSKQRNGPTGIVKVAFTKETMRFRNYEETGPMDDIPVDFDNE